MQDVFFFLAYSIKVQRLKSRRLSPAITSISSSRFSLSIANWISFTAPRRVSLVSVPSSTTVIFWDFVFDYPARFEDHWSDILWNISQFGFVWCFSHGRLGLMSFGEGDHRCKMPLPSHHFKGTHNQDGLSRLMLTLIICLEARFVRFLYCKVIKVIKLY